MSDRLSLRRLNRATLARQALLERARGPVADIVGRLAGLQAQHANAPYVALWSRRTDQAIADLETALADRTVVKATLMRSTLHLVAAADYPMFDAATAEARIANWAPTARRVGLDLGVLHAALLEYCAEPRSVADIEAHLEPLVRGRLSDFSVSSGVRNVAFRMAAAAGGVVHVPPSGRWRSHDRPRYLDARRWLGDEAAHDGDTALERSIERYLRAYGPASLEDIGKWVGQPRVTRIRAAIARSSERFRPWSDPAGRALVDLADAVVADEDRPAPPRFLSRWDSVLIGYDDRDRILPPAHRAAVIRKNGDFLPSFLIDGFVAGLWSTEVTGDEAILRLAPFVTVPPTDHRALLDEAERLVRYVEPQASRHAVDWTAPA